MRQCSTCKVKKNLTEFWVYSFGRPHYSCKDCETDKTMRRLYGITLGDYARMFEEQNGVCAVCGQASTGTRLHIDHDHTTGRVRGLLCFKCNSVLGKVNDDPEHLLTLVAYLENF